MRQVNGPKYTLCQLASYFLKLGYSGFGGPVALVGYMYRDLVDGITAAVIGALVGAVIIIAIRGIVDIPTLLIALVSMIILISSKKIKEPYIILAAAMIGILLKLLLQ
jgi:chromate transport protein ChrA